MKSRLRNGLLVLISFLAACSAHVELGTLVGGDITDPKDVIADTTSGLTCTIGSKLPWRDVVTNSYQPVFSHMRNRTCLTGVGHLFDNKVGERSNWVEDGVNKWVGLELHESLQISHFTLSSGTELDADPSHWRLEGYSSAASWYTIFEHQGSSPFTARSQTLRYDVGADFKPTPATKWFKFRVLDSVGQRRIEVGELELFGAGMLPFHLKLNSFANYCYYTARPPRPPQMS